jgi:hypothetical protein
LKRTQAIGKIVECVLAVISNAFRVAQSMPSDGVALEQKAVPVMNGNDSTSSVCDQEAEAVIVGGPVVGSADDTLGQLLQGFRAYLLIVAKAELASDLRGKCGASDVVPRDRELAMRTGET